MYLCKKTVLKIRCNSLLNKSTVLYVFLILVLVYILEQQRSAESIKYLAIDQRGRNCSLFSFQYI